MRVRRKMCCGVLVLLALSVAARAQSKPTQPTEQSCRTFVQGFYDWYRSGHSFRDVPKNKKYPLDDNLIRLFEALYREEERTQDVVLDFDPFVNSQDPAERYVVKKTSINGNTCQAEVYGDWPASVTNSRKGADVIPEVVYRDGKRLFVNFRYHYSNDPREYNLVDMLVEMTKPTK